MDICSAEPAAVALKSLILYKKDETDESMLHAVFHCWDRDRSTDVAGSILTIKYRQKWSLCDEEFSSCNS